MAGQQAHLAHVTLKAKVHALVHREPPRPLLGTNGATTHRHYLQRVEIIYQHGCLARPVEPRDVMTCWELEDAKAAARAKGDTWHVSPSGRRWREGPPSYWYQDYERERLAEAWFDLFEFSAREGRAVA